MKKETTTICDSNATFSATSINVLTGAGEEIVKPSLLLHSCCGPCSTAVVERLASDYHITVFFYNPCITDQNEYEKRKAAQIQFIHAYNEEHAECGTIAFLEGNYEPDKFFEQTLGLEEEPEGGKRCKVCFSMRLRQTAQAAVNGGYEIFGTTLTVSPHKNYPLISALGKEIAEEYGIEFLDRDFKKKAGFQRSIQLSKAYNLYRQNYCGCKYSKRP